MNKLSYSFITDEDKEPIDLLGSLIDSYKDNFKPFVITEECFRKFISEDVTVSFLEYYIECLLNYLPYENESKKKDLFRMIFKFDKERLRIGDGYFTHLEIKFWHALNNALILELAIYGNLNEEGELLFYLGINSLNKKIIINDYKLRKSLDEEMFSYWIEALIYSHSANPNYEIIEEAKRRYLKD